MSLLLFLQCVHTKSSFCPFLVNSFSRLLRSHEYKMLAATFLLLVAALSVSAQQNVTSWHVVWVGGQSNSVGTNTQRAGYPTWPLTPAIQMYNFKKDSFSPAQYPIYNDDNVGFSLTYANLLLSTLPAGHGVVLVSTGVGGTGFHAHQWNAPDGPLLVRSVNVTQALFRAITPALGGSATMHSFLWHQGEQDAGDNKGLLRAPIFQASYCTYLCDDLSPLIDFLREQVPTASATTPFVDGGLLPFWLDKVAGTDSVESAIYAVNTSRACTGTADSRVFSDYNPDGTPAGDPNARSGASDLVIHFTATQQSFFGFEYWRAYLRALGLTTVVPSDQTKACPTAAIQPSVTACG